MSLFKKGKKTGQGKKIKKGGAKNYIQNDHQMMEGQDPRGDQYENMITPRNDQAQNMERVEEDQEEELAGQ